jgi:DNA-binding transcriptional LysR family regulator
MKFRHLEYFVTAAEELNFTHAADRLHVSQPPFSKQIHDLEGELGIDLFERQSKGVALTPAGKSFLIDARGILEDCQASIRKAQRISRGEVGELAIGYMSALTHEFLERHSKSGDSLRQTLSSIASRWIVYHRRGLYWRGASPWAYWCLAIARCWRC